MPPMQGAGKRKRAVPKDRPGGFVRGWGGSYLTVMVVGMPRQAGIVDCQDPARPGQPFGQAERR